MELSPHESPKKPRPYWHKDAKWVLGLILFVAMGAWLLFVVAWRVSAPEPAIKLTTNLLTLNFTRPGTDDAKAIEDLRKKVAESPNGEYHPIPNFPVVIAAADLNLSPKAIRERVFRQITEPLYYKGARGLAQSATKDPAQQEKFVKDASALELMTQDKHNLLGSWVIFGGLILALVIGGVVYFSHRFGRLVTPALVTLFAAIPGLIIFSGFHRWVTSPVTPATGASEGEQWAAIVANAKGAFEPLASLGQHTYLVAVIAALVMLGVALIGRLVYGIIKHYNKNKAKPHHAE